MPKIIITPGSGGQAIDNPNDVLVQCEGVEYGAWGDSRNGHSTGDLIEHPVGCIESILRDWKHRESDLRSEPSGGDPTLSAFPDLLYSIDDYYNGAFLHTVTQDTTALVTDYDGSSKTVTISPGITLSDEENVFFNNVNCNIDETVFDATEVSRQGWEFAHTINDETTSEALLDELCFESHTFLFPSVNSDSGRQLYKLVPLDAGTELATLGRPVHAEGEDDMHCRFTPLSQLFNEFRIQFAFDYGSNAYLNETFINKTGSSDTSNTVLTGSINPTASVNVVGVGTLFTTELVVGDSILVTGETRIVATITDNTLLTVTVAFSDNANDTSPERLARLGSTYKALCRGVETNYKIIRPFTYQANWIYDETTALLFTQKLVNWHTSKRLQVQALWSPEEVIRYETGDLLKIDYDKKIPTDLNNSAIFMITKKVLIPSLGGATVNPAVLLRLEQMI